MYIQLSAVCLVLSSGSCSRTHFFHHLQLQKLPWSRTPMARVRGQWNQLCPLCDEKIPEGEARRHHHVCVCPWQPPIHRPQDRFPPIAFHRRTVDDDLSPMEFLIGGIGDLKCSGITKRIRNHIAEGCLDPRGCRPDHEGQIHAFGWCKRWGRWHKGSINCYIKSMVANLMKEMKDMPTVQFWLGDSIQSPLIMPGFAKEAVFIEQGANMYLAVGYSPVESGSLGTHGPPPAVADILRVASCRVNCGVCRQQGGCLLCSKCCLHTDAKDKTVTVLIQYQKATTTRSRTAFFCIGSKAFPIVQGISAIFDGSVQPHGLWCPPDMKDEDAPFGAALVSRKR